MVVIRIFKIYLKYRAYQVCDKQTPVIATVEVEFIFLLSDMVGILDFFSIKF